MKTPETKGAARPALESATSAGMTRLPPRVDSSGKTNLLRTKKNRTHSMQGAAVGVRPLMRRIGGVDSVHTFGFGLGRTSVGSGRIRHVSGSSQCLQGLESGSSPTSGTRVSAAGGLFRPPALLTLPTTLCSEMVWTAPPEPLFSCSWPFAWPVRPFSWSLAMFSRSLLHCPDWPARHDVTWFVRGARCCPASCRFLCA